MIDKKKRKSNLRNKRADNREKGFTNLFEYMVK